MEETSTDRGRRLWKAALRDAAGTLASYLTPAGYGVSTLEVTPVARSEQEAFIREIQRRLDFGRAVVATEEIACVAGSISSAYRHRLSYSDRQVRGKIHVPRYIVSRADGGQRGIPVIRAERQLATPENLLVSEAIQQSLAVAESWAGKAGAEAERAADLTDRLQRIEAREPWAELRAKPRPPLTDLLAIVRARLVAGIVDPNGPIPNLLEVLAEASGDVAAFEEAASGLYLLASRDPRFADRLFELLCLAWMLDGLGAQLEEFSVWPAHIRSSSGGAVLEGHQDETRYRLFFQTGKPLGTKRWRWWSSGQNKMALLRALPDFIIEIQKRGHPTRLVILDAKYRSWNAKSEVAYKFLGYKENLNLQQFTGFAIFPTERKLRIVRLRRGENTVVFVGVPMLCGRRATERLIKTMTDT